MSCSVCAGYSSHDCPCCGTEPQKITCPACKGTGHGDWKVWDIIKRVEVTCNEIAYRTSPRNEDDAIRLGKRYCRYSCTCKTCGGDGEIVID